MSARVDIFIPYWGDFCLLQETVRSVFNQTSDAWHLTILDDHYPSEEAYHYYRAHPDQRLTYIRHAKNIGITHNFNTALQRATAEYCMIVGCDDRLLPHYVETALAHIGQADFYQPGVQVIDADGHTYLSLADRVKRWLQPKKSGLYHGERLAASLCHGNWLYFPSILWRTSTLKRYSFDASYTILEDVVLELAMIADGATLYFDTAETFQYRRFAESLSSKEKGKHGVRFAEERQVYRHAASVFQAHGWRRAARAARLRLTSRIHQTIS